HDRHHGGEDRPVDEEMRNPHDAGPYFALAWGFAAGWPAGAAPSSCGVTFWPARARIRPLTTTRSLGSRPSLMTRSPSTTWPSVTFLDLATLSSPITSTNLRTCSVPIALSG